MAGAVWGVRWFDGGAFSPPLLLLEPLLETGCAFTLSAAALSERKCVSQPARGNEEKMWGAWETRHVSEQLGQHQSANIQIQTSDLHGVWL